MRGVVIAGLFVASATLVGVLLLERRASVDVPAPIGAPAVASGVVTPGGAAAGRTAPGRAAPDSAAATAEAAVSVILARPLFEPRRRPVTTATSAANPAEKLPRLTGVLVTPAGRHVIFASPVHGKPVIATEGSHIGNFVVQSIASGEVTVLGPDGAHTIRPAFDASRATPALADGIAPSRPNPPPVPPFQALPTLQAPPT